jgi:hypothetical protein
VWFALLAGAGTAAPTLVAAQAPDSPPPPEPAVVADETPEELQVNGTRLRVHGGVLYGTVSGSEVEKTDPAFGFEIGGSFRVLRGLSICGSFAKSRSNVDGQVVQLLDVPVRVDGRSGTVDGRVDFDRFRVGVRVDGLRQPSFRVQPYLLGAATFTKNKVKLDTVDRAKPAQPSYDDSQIGGVGQFGVEVGVAPRIGVDAHFVYEVFEFPPATNSSLGVGAGVALRL